MSNVDLGLDVIDEFCGWGGASIGLREAGYNLVLGINHWDLAVEVHQRNFPAANHWCEDSSKLDMRRLPPARGLWASPICTELSPAGGRKRTRKQVPGQTEIDLQAQGHVPKAALVKTRTTFYDVLRAAEVRRFDFVVVENVVEVADDWELFDHWVEGMKIIDYNVQFISVDAAHVGGEVNPNAPQWRGRLYMVFTRKGIPLPDVDPRPLAWCSECGRDVHAIQSWKKLHKGRKIGSYGRNGQYDYRCERTECRHALVEPYILPAEAAIDWSDLGTRIGDRPPKKRYGGLPLAPNTLRRIEVGRLTFGVPSDPPADDSAGCLVPVGGTWRTTPETLRTAMPCRTTSQTDGVAFPDSAFLFSTNHGGQDPRAYQPGERPLPTRTARLGDGLVVPYVTELRGGHSFARPIDHPLATMVAGGRHHGLTIPDGAFIDVARTHNRPRGIDEPLAPVTTGRNHALVIPFRRGAKPHPAGARPLGAQLTNVQDGVAWLDNADLMATRFRMLQPRETLRAQRFPDDYEVLGNPGEQYMGAGNAVAANVAHWIGAALRPVLDGSAA